MNQATRDYIQAHAGDDVRQLALRGTKDSEVDLTFALEQIDGRQKAKTKLPTWAAIDGIVYPPHLSMEQCSSEQTARYKASMTGKGRLVVDLTAGFGVDMAFISQGFERAIHVERQPQLCTISSDNYKRLGLHHIEVICGDGINYLHSLDHADLIYLDPARRDEHGGRTYGIADCTPNVLEILDELLEKADCVLLKLSPMLDWRKAVAELKKVREVHIVSVDNECKELLIKVKNGKGEKVKTTEVVCVNLLSDGHHQFFKFTYSPQAIYSSPSQGGDGGGSYHFLFEPNASIMKAGCFDLLAERFGVRQVDKNSHLFVSDKDLPDFPGRQFIIERITSMNKRELKEALAGIDRANITVRNFPMSVAELRKKLKLKDGGDVYVFATTVAEQGHQLLICRKKS
ncbi:MAG: SAM-dependent methyltransferase [Prevotella sp.]|nr:SAM-dependent methyltransferase [Prevotella sp.]